MSSLRTAGGVPQNCPDRGFASEHAPVVSVNTLTPVASERRAPRDVSACYLVARPHQGVAVKKAQVMTPLKTLS